MIRSNVTRRSGCWVATEKFRPVLGDFYAQGWHLRNTWAERGSRRKRLHFFDETEIFAPGELDTIPCTGPSSTRAAAAGRPAL